MASFERNGSVRRSRLQRFLRVFSFRRRGQSSSSTRRVEGGVEMAEARNTASFGWPSFNDDVGTSDSMHHHHATPEPLEPKRKRFSAFHAVRNIFRRKPKQPLKDDRRKSSTLKSQSTGELAYLVSSRNGERNLLDPSISPRLSSQEENISIPSYNNRLSLSHDSVFAPEMEETMASPPKTPKQTNSFFGPSVLTDGFKKELANRLQGRRVDSDEDDAGLPHSPSTSPTTADVLHQSLIENSKGFLSSDGSLLSMGSSETDNEDGSIPVKLSFNNPGADPDLDVKSSGLLNNRAAKHKIAVRPRRSRTVSNQRQGSITASSVLPATPEDKEETKFIVDTSAQESSKRELKTQSSINKSQSQSFNKKTSPLNSPPPIIPRSHSTRDTKVNSNQEENVMKEVASYRPQPAERKVQQEMKAVLRRKNSENRGDDVSNPSSPDYQKKSNTIQQPGKKEEKEENKKDDEETSTSCFNFLISSKRESTTSIETVEKKDLKMKQDDAGEYGFTTDGTIKRPKAVEAFKVDANEKNKNESNSSPSIPSPDYSIKALQFDVNVASGSNQQEIKKRSEGVSRSSSIKKFTERLSMTQNVSPNAALTLKSQKSPEPEYIFIEAEILFDNKMPDLLMPSRKSSRVEDSKIAKMRSEQFSVGVHADKTPRNVKTIKREISPPKELKIGIEPKTSSTSTSEDLKIVKMKSEQFSSGFREVHADKAIPNVKSVKREGSPPKELKIGIEPKTSSNTSEDLKIAKMKSEQFSSRFREVHTDQTIPNLKTVKREGSPPKELKIEIESKTSSTGTSNVQVDNRRRPLHRLSAEELKELDVPVVSAKDVPIQKVNTTPKPVSVQVKTLGNYSVPSPDLVSKSGLSPNWQKPSTESVAIVPDRKSSFSLVEPNDPAATSPIGMNVHRQLREPKTSESSRRYSTNSGLSPEIKLSPLSMDLVKEIVPLITEKSVAVEKSEILKKSEDTVAKSDVATSNAVENVEDEPFKSVFGVRLRRSIKHKDHPKSADVDTEPAPEISSSTNSDENKILIELKPVALQKGLPPSDNNTGFGQHQLRKSRPYSMIADFKNYAQKTDSNGENKEKEMTPIEIPVNLEQEVISKVEIKPPEKVENIPKVIHGIKRESVTVSKPLKRNSTPKTEPSVSNVLLPDNISITIESKEAERSEAIKVETVAKPKVPISKPVVDAPSYTVPQFRKSNFLDETPNSKIGTLFINSIQRIPSMEKKEQPKVVTSETVQNPPLETRKSSPLETRKSSPLETRKSSPLESTKSPSLETTKSPPLETTKSPPLETTKSPLLETTKSPPLKTTKSPPLETMKSPPLETMKSPPMENKKSPPMENKKSPPLETMKSPPLETKKSPPLEVKKINETNLVYERRFRRSDQQSQNVSKNVDKDNKFNYEPPNIQIEEYENKKIVEVNSKDENSKVVKARSFDETPSLKVGSPMMTNVKRKSIFETVNVALNEKKNDEILVTNVTRKSVFETVNVAINGKKSDEILVASERRKPFFEPVKVDLNEKKSEEKDAKSTTLVISSEILKVPSSNVQPVENSPVLTEGSGMSFERRKSSFNSINGESNSTNGATSLANNNMHRNFSGRKAFQSLSTGTTDMNKNEEKSDPVIAEGTKVQNSVKSNFTSPAMRKISSGVITPSDSAQPKVTNIELNSNSVSNGNKLERSSMIENSANNNDGEPEWRKLVTQRQKQKELQAQQELETAKLRDSKTFIIEHEIKPKPMKRTTNVWSMVSSLQNQQDCS